MTTTRSDQCDPLYLGRNLEQWWVKFLSAPYVDDMDLLCKALITSPDSGAIWDFRASQCIGGNNTNYICQALPCFGSTFVQKAMETLFGVDPRRQARLVFCIGCTGLQSVPCLVSLLKHPSANLRAAACVGLYQVYWDSRCLHRSPDALHLMVGFIRGPRLPKEMDAFFEDLDCAEPTTTIVVDAKVVVGLVERLEDDYQAVQLVAIEALRLLLKDPYIIEELRRLDVVAALLGKLKDHHQAVRLMAMKALTWSGCQEAHLTKQDTKLAAASIEEIVAALHDRDIAVRLAAINALVEIGSTDVDAVGHVLEMFEDTGQPVRIWAQRALNLMVRNKSEAWEHYMLQGPPSRLSSIE